MSDNKNTFYTRIQLFNLYNVDRHALQYPLKKKE
jgi:hypothetical protein